VEVVLDLQRRRVAHGDLQHGNILVSPGGALKLVDYDGMFVPAMRQARMSAAEIGLPAYQHPQRDAHDFDERLDDFGALVILLTLACVDGRLWRRYHTNDDHLLLGAHDLQGPGRSPLLAELTRSPDAALNKLAVMLTISCRGDRGAVPPFQRVVADPAVRQLLNGRVAADRPERRATTRRVKPRPKVPARKSRGGCLQAFATVAALAGCAVAFAVWQSNRAGPASPPDTGLVGPGVVQGGGSQVGGINPNPPHNDAGRGVRENSGILDAQVVRVQELDGSPALVVRASFRLTPASDTQVRLVARFFSDNRSPVISQVLPSPSFDGRRGWGPPLTATDYQATAWQVVDLPAGAPAGNGPFDLYVPPGGLPPGSGYYAEVELQDLSTGEPQPLARVKTSPFSVNPR
jgi:hypothetical protein